MSVQQNNRNELIIVKCSLQTTDHALFAGEFQLFQLTRHWQIHSWPIAQSTSRGIQFHQYAVFFSLRKQLVRFLVYKILCYALVDVKWKSKNFSRHWFFDWVISSIKWTPLQFWCVMGCMPCFTRFSWTVI